MWRSEVDDGQGPSLNPELTVTARLQQAPAIFLPLPGECLAHHFYVGVGHVNRLLVLQALHPVSCLSPPALTFIFDNNLEHSHRAEWLQRGTAH